MKAKRSGKTKTEIVIDALRNLFHLGGKAQKHHQLKAFFGKMSQEDVKRFQKATEAFSEIDANLWK